jgi:hypothetical protein
MAALSFIPFHGPCTVSIHNDTITVESNQTFTVQNDGTIRTIGRSYDTQFQPVNIHYQNCVIHTVILGGCSIKATNSTIKHLTLNNGSLITDVLSNAVISDGYVQARIIDSLILPAPLEGGTVQLVNTSGESSTTTQHYFPKAFSHGYGIMSSVQDHNQQQQPPPSSEPVASSSQPIEQAAENQSSSLGSPPDIDLSSIEFSQLQHTIDLSTTTFLPEPQQQQQQEEQIQINLSSPPKSPVHEPELSPPRPSTPPKSPVHEPELSPERPSTPFPLVTAPTTPLPAIQKNKPSTPPFSPIFTDGDEESGSSQPSGSPEMFSTPQPPKNTSESPVNVVVPKSSQVPRRKRGRGFALTTPKRSAAKKLTTPQKEQPQPSSPRTRSTTAAARSLSTSSEPQPSKKKTTTTTPKRARRSITSLSDSTTTAPSAPHFTKIHILNTDSSTDPNNQNDGFF